MIRIDAHQHFWKYDKLRDTWMTDSMFPIRKDFLPVDLKEQLQGSGFDGSILIQSAQCEEENFFQLKNAAENSFVHGVVGWTDLTAPNVQDRLRYYKQFSQMKGFRHTLQDEIQRDYMLRPDFLRGILALREFDYTYDILIYPDQLGFTKEFIARFPNQKFVIDHLAKPYIKDRKIKVWERDIREIASYENVYCKISGYTTEANWHHWSASDFKPYFDIVAEAFGTGRMMIGSDWPVCVLSGGYKEVMDVAVQYFSSFSTSEIDDIFGNNAITFYNLQI